MLLFFTNLFADFSQLNQILEQRLRSEFAKISIKELTIHPLNKIPDDFESYTIENLTILNYKKNGGNFKISIKQNSSNRTLFFKFDLDAKIPALVAARDISSKKILNLGDFNQEMVLFEHYKKGILQEFPKQNLIAKQMIKKGKILNESNFKIPYDVQKGDKLQAILNDNSLSLKMSVLALGSGNLGDEIEVLAKENKKIKARIISKKEVLLR